MGGIGFGYHSVNYVIVMSVVGPCPRQYCLCQHNRGRWIAATAALPNCNADGDANYSDNASVNDSATSNANVTSDASVGPQMQLVSPL